MRKAITQTVVFGCVGMAIMAYVQARGQSPPAPRPNPDSQYRLGPDSLPQEGVPKGEIRGPYTLPSQVYPGTQHTYWVYVPAQYDPAVPAALMVFQDGQAFKDERGRHAGAERDGQPDLPARDPGHDRGVHQPRPPARPARADAAELGRPRHQPADRVQLARRQVRPGRSPKN